MLNGILLQSAFPEILADSREAFWAGLPPRCPFYRPGDGILEGEALADQGERTLDSNPAVSPNPPPRYPEPPPALNTEADRDCHPPPHS